MGDRLSRLNWTSPLVHGPIRGSGVEIELGSDGLMRVVLLQPPAFRREAPATSLAEALAVPRISFGDLIRAHLRQGTELGNRVAELLNSGSLVPDEICTAVVRNRLHQAADAAFLLVGHPSSAVQAIALDKLLRNLDRPLDGVLHLHLPQAEVERLVRRLAARRICRKNSAHWFESEGDQPLVDRVCAVCGGELVQRRDDHEDVVRNRFTSHAAMLEPVIQHYGRQNLLVTIDAIGTSDEIARRALTELRDRGPRPDSGQATS